METTKPAGLSLSIVGFGHTVLHNVRRLRDSDEVWAINNSHAHYGYGPNRIIAMDDLKRDETEHPRYVREIVKAGVPVYTCAAYPDWPNTVAYPLAAVMASLGLGKRLAQAVFTNTWCYAVALALHEGWKKLRLYGAEFEPLDSMTDVEWCRSRLGEAAPDWFTYYSPEMVRRPTEPGVHGFTFLLGVAFERDVAFRLAPGSTLLDWDRPGFFYGYTKQPR